MLWISKQSYCNAVISHRSKIKRWEDGVLLVNIYFYTHRLIQSNRFSKVVVIKYIYTVSAYTDNNLNFIIVPIKLEHY